MDISVVILTWNSQDYIEKSIRKLIEDIGNLYEYEIFIVDNGSTDNTISHINQLKKRFVKGIKPILLDRNYGTTYSRNIALRKAVGRFIIIMDSDVEVVKGTIRRLIDFLKNEPKAGIVAPKLIYPNGNLQKSTDAFPTILTKVLRYFFLRLLERKESAIYQETGVRKVDYAISAMWVMRRDLLEKVGLLDEKIFYAPEDVDYCLRIWKAGYKILYVPDVTCVHHTQEISRGIKINKATLEHIRGLAYYFKKHNYLFKKPRIVAH